MSHPYFRGGETPIVLAHRGLVTAQLAARGIVENSRAAIVAARDAGAHYIESDCHLTSDGEAVLFHDADLRRVTGDPRRIAEVSLPELRDVMAPLGGLATLAHTLAEFPECRFNIDVKAEAAAEPAGRIVAPHGERVLLTSFSDARRRRALAAADRVLGTVRPATSPGRSALIRILLALATGSPRLAGRALRGLDALQIPERQGVVRVLSPRLVDAAHRAGVQVHVWTVNDPAEMRRLVRLGVDGVVTDRADVGLAALSL